MQITNSNALLSNQPLRLNLQTEKVTIQHLRSKRIQWAKKTQWSSPLDFKAVIRQINKETIKRLDTQTPESTTIRLQRRLSNCRILEKILNNPQSDWVLVGVWGWGKQASGASSKTGVSQYDSLCLRHQKSNIIRIVELDSSYQTQLEVGLHTYTKESGLVISTSTFDFQHVGRIYEQFNPHHSLYEGPFSQLKKRPSSPPSSISVESISQKSSSSVKSLKSRPSHSSSVMPVTPLLKHAKSDSSGSAVLDINAPLISEIDDLDSDIDAAKPKRALSVQDFRYIPWERSPEIKPQSKSDKRETPLFSTNCDCGTPHTLGLKESEDDLESLQWRWEHPKQNRDITRALNAATMPLEDPIAATYKSLPRPENHTPRFKIQKTSHDNHTHVTLQKSKSPRHAVSIRDTDEGCPCCTTALDLDEIAAAIKETVSAAEPHSTEQETLLGNFPEMSADHWGIFLGIAGPLSIIGLTAAIRNIQGGWSNREKITQVIQAVESDIKANKTLGNAVACEKLEAFKRCLEYSKFDTERNIAVPGFVNGAASTLVLSSAFWSSPWALPVIATYATAQTGLNLYDLIRTWNHILELPQGSLALKKTTVSGIKKVNKITQSKRNFYAANALGFATFAAGALLTFLSVPAMGLFGAGSLMLPLGLILMGIGSTSTGIMNNIWPRKFRPRNGDLGISRLQLTRHKCLDEIGIRNTKKKILKKAKTEQLPLQLSHHTQKFGYRLLTALPFGSTYGTKLNHQFNRDHLKANPILESKRLKTLEEMYRSTTGTPPSIQDEDTSHLLKVWRLLSNLGISEDVVLTFCEEFMPELEDKCCTTHSETCCGHAHTSSPEQDYMNKLKSTGVFVVLSEDTISFDIMAILRNDTLRSRFLEAIDYFLFYRYIKKLRYELYGINDFFWQLKPSNDKVIA